ncbi:MAG: TolC family protein, partial [Polaromonas sp.]|nr:TolC family protein [Polaromonas sp.]
MKRLTALFVLLASPLPGLTAEEPLSLDGAVALALERAPQVAARDAAREAAASLATSAGRLPDPQALFGVDNLPLNGPDAGSLTRDFMTMRKIGVMQEFPSAAGRRAQRARATTDARIAAAELAVTQLDVARATAQA